MNWSVYIKNTETKGRGIFTETIIAANTVVEDAPVIIMTREERIYLDKTLLHDYIFEWGMNKEKCCVALGCVSIFNHSYASNCTYIMNYDDDTITIKTVREILAGEELTINYNGEWDDTTPLWFDAK